MELKLDIERINDEKVIPSIILTILFMALLFLMLSKIKIPLEASKPSEEMILEFIREEKKPEVKKEEKKQEKPEEKPEVTEEIEEQITTEDIPQIDPEELEKLVTNVQPVQITVDISKEITQDIEQMLDNFPGADGVVDIVTDIDNPNALMQSGADMGGEMSGFDGGVGEVQLSMNSRDLQFNPHTRRSRTVQPGARTGVPHLNMAPKDFINPIIKWMEANPFTFSEILKTYLNWSPGNLTSKVRVKYEGQSYHIFFLCKKAIPQLSICVINFATEELILIKDAELLQTPGYLMEGEVMAEGDKIFYIDSQQKKASSASAVKFNKIFWSWFETVKPK